MWYAIKKTSSHWKQVPRWQDIRVNIANTTMFKNLKEKLDIVHEEMGNFG